MKARGSSLQNESGFILVATMVILLLLVILGIAATMTGTIETQIAGNEKAYKTNFYETDGGLELGELLIEENLSCPSGFQEFPASSGYAELPNTPTPNVRVYDLDFAWSTPLAASDRAAWDSMDISFPASLGVPDATTGDIEEQAYLLVGGETLYAKGGSLQMAAGYMGKGKSIAGGGAYIMSTMYAKREGQAESLSELKSCWRHVVGQEGPCQY